MRLALVAWMLWVGIGCCCSVCALGDTGEEPGTGWIAVDENGTTHIHASAGVLINGHDLALLQHKVAPFVSSDGATQQRRRRHPTPAPKPTTTIDQAAETLLPNSTTPFVSVTQDGNLEISTWPAALMVNGINVTRLAADVQEAAVALGVPPNTDGTGTTTGTQHHQHVLLKVGEDAAIAVVDSGALHVAARGRVVINGVDVDSLAARVADIDGLPAYVEAHLEAVPGNPASTPVGTAGLQLTGRGLASFSFGTAVPRVRGYVQLGKNALTQIDFGSLTYVGANPRADRERPPPHPRPRQPADCERQRACRQWNGTPTSAWTWAACSKLA